MVEYENRIFELCNNEAEDERFFRKCAALAKRHKISITGGRSPGLSQERM